MRFGWINISFHRCCMKDFLDFFLSIVCASHFQFNWEERKNKAKQSNTRKAASRRT